MFNLRTAQFEVFNTKDDLFKAYKTGDYFPTYMRPNSNCKKCWGRGYIGFNEKIKKYIPCKCIHIKNPLQNSLIQDINENKLDTDNKE